MITFTKDIHDKANITAYLHEERKELGNATVRPAVLIFPGGGYFMCSDREAEPVAFAYLAEGYHVFICRYTVGTDTSFEAALTDAKAALQILRGNAKEWKIDKEKIVTVGFSAGGHLVSALGTIGTKAEEKPAAMIIGYPVVLSSLGELLQREIPSTSDFVDEKTPPTFLFTTRDDVITPVEHTLALAGALDKAGVPFELHVFRQGEHGLSLAKPHTSNGNRNLVNPVVSQWFGMSVVWLKETIGDFSFDK